MQQLPASTSKRDVSLTLGSETLRVAVAGTVLLEGKLSGSVRGFDGGSLWEMVKEYGKMVSQGKEVQQSIYGCAVHVSI